MRKCLTLRLGLLPGRFKSQYHVSYQHSCNQVNSGEHAKGGVFGGVPENQRTLPQHARKVRGACQICFLVQLVPAVVP